MILTGAILLGLLAAWLAIAGVEAFRLGIGFRQALLYVPFKLVYRIDDRGIRDAAQGRGAGHLRRSAHQSQLDPALMLSLLPEQTLHILDEYSANVGLAGAVARACPHHRLQRRARVRQPRGWCAC